MINLRDNQFFKNFTQSALELRALFTAFINQHLSNALIYQQYTSNIIQKFTAEITIARKEKNDYQSYLDTYHSIHGDIQKKLDNVEKDIKQLDAALTTLENKDKTYREEVTTLKRKMQETPAERTEKNEHKVEEITEYQKSVPSTQKVLLEEYETKKNERALLINLLRQENKYKSKVDKASTIIDEKEKFLAAFKKLTLPISTIEIQLDSDIQPNADDMKDAMLLSRHYDAYIGKGGNRDEEKIFDNVRFNPLYLPKTGSFAGAAIEHFENLPDSSPLIKLTQKLIAFYMSMSGCIANIERLSFPSRNRDKQPFMNMYTNISTTLHQTFPPDDDSVQQEKVQKYAENIAVTLFHGHYQQTALEEETRGAHQLALFKQDHPDLIASMDQKCKKFIIYVLNQQEWKFTTSHLEQYIISLQAFYQKAQKSLFRSEDEEDLYTLNLLLEHDAKIPLAMEDMFNILPEIQAIVQSYFLDDQELIAQLLEMIVTSQVMRENYQRLLQNFNEQEKNALSPSG